VVVAIIALLLGILTVSLGKARDAAKITKCLSKLHQHGLMISMYTNDWQGAYPVAPDEPPANTPRTSEFRYRDYWLAIDEHFPQPLDEQAEIDLAYICPGYRQRWADVDMDTTGQDWLAVQWSGYHANFANFTMLADPVERYRSLGAVRTWEVGGSGGRAEDVGAVRATAPGRMIMLADAGFVTVPDEQGDESSMSGQKLGHDGGWTALMADGHAAQFAKANAPSPWYAHYVLKP
jgi:hypothetical protein